MLRKQLFDTSRGRVVALLQRGALTVDELAAKIGVTANAVRAQLTAMERDGVVRRVGQRPGTTRPFHVYELTAEVEQLLSRAYIPLLTHLIGAFTQGLPGDQMNALLRTTGKELAAGLAAGRRLSGNLRSRAFAASEIMNEQLGAVTRVQENGRYVIQGEACPLAAVTGKHPAVCLAMESFVTELVRAPVHECCNRTGRPRCCFEIKGRRGSSL
jgi:predicted ArsR family transcriptional regulator